MKSIVTEGTVERTPCEQCQKLVPATYSYGPVEHEGLIVEDVMRAVCNQCGDIVATTPQSAHRFREAIQNRNAKRTTVRIPQELQDFICLNLSAAGADTSHTELYLKALLLACHSREAELGPVIAAANSPVLQRPNKVTVNLTLGPQLLNTLTRLATESQIPNTSEILRRLLVLADGPLESNVNQEFQRLAYAYA